MTARKRDIQTFYHDVNPDDYRGDDVICSICQSTFRIFAPHGLEVRQNSRCLNCGSLERHRLLWMYLNEKTNIWTRSRKKLLHFAPEPIFYYLFSTVRNIKYFPCDLQPELYSLKGGSIVVKVDITSIPFEDNSFDVILCSHVLEHVKNDHLAMRELRRVLKKKGWGIFQVPIDNTKDVTYEDASIITPEARKTAFGQHDHVRLYGNDYKDRLAAAGLEVHADPYVRQFTKEEIFRYGFDSEEIIFFCKKG